MIFFLKNSNDTLKLFKNIFCISCRSSVLFYVLFYIIVCWGIFAIFVSLEQHYIKCSFNVVRDMYSSNNKCLFLFNSNYQCSIYALKLMFLLEMTFPPSPVRTPVHACVKRVIRRNACPYSKPTANNRYR